MRKLFCAAMAVLLSLSTAACGSGNADAQTSASVNSDAATGITNQTTAVTTQSTTTETAFEEIMLVENDDITFTITAVTEDPVWGYTLRVYMENKTDKTLMFSLIDTSVNGFMCDPFWAETVAAGKRSNSGISWLSSDFEDNGIVDVEDIAFTLRVYDYNDWTAEDVLNETFTVHMH